jgi:small GTP-binding protein
LHAAIIDLTLFITFSHPSTMSTRTHEIRIAFLGHVSVGKSTVLNAILCSEYSEVAMRRATACVNHFVLSTADKDGNQANKKVRLSSGASGNVRSASSTLKEIKEDNKNLRDSNTVVEKKFAIEIQDDLCEMRKDTQLTLIDIPGINEAGASTKYKDYVKDKWSTFDCVVVVMDAKQGVNTEDQLQLLRSIYSYNITIKAIPVIIIANKVDEPGEQEQAVMLKELREAVEKVFNTTCREKSLTELLKLSEKKQNLNVEQLMNLHHFPAVVPLSAIHAFIYRTASLMTFDVFKKFDNNLIQKIGREEVGRSKWNRLSQEAQYKEAFNVVSDPAMCNDGLQASNFDSFLRVLSCAVGGKLTQSTLLMKQVELKMKQIKHDQCLVAQIDPLVAEMRKIPQSNAKNLGHYFWLHYGTSKALAISKLNHPTDLRQLSIVMDQLTAYLGRAADIIDRKRTLEEMKSLVVKQLEVLISMFKLWCSAKAQTESQEQTLPWSWLVLSPNEWLGILTSVLAVSHTKAAVKSLSNELSFLSIARTVCEPFLQKSSSVCYLCGSTIYTQEYYSHHGKFCIPCPKCHWSFAVSTKPGQCHIHTDIKLDSQTGFCTSCNINYRRLPKSPRSWIKCGTWSYANGRFSGSMAAGMSTIFYNQGVSDTKHLGYLLWAYSEAFDKMK